MVPTEILDEFIDALHNVRDHLGDDGGNESNSED